MHAGCILCILLSIVPLSGITLKHKQCNCNSGAVKINANLKILTAAIVHKIYRRASVRCILCLLYYCSQEKQHNYKR